MLAASTASTGLLLSPPPLTLGLVNTKARSKEFYESKYWSDNANHDHTAGEGSGSPTETSIRGKPKSPESIRSRTGEPQQVSQVSWLWRNDPDTQQNNFTIRVIISQFPRGRLEIMRA